jgi:hypothetical protein
VSGESLFSYAQKELVDQISSTNVNLNVWKLFAQYWTETTYTDEANYDIVNRTIADNAFTIYYRNVLKHLDEAATLIAQNELVGLETQASIDNKLAIIEIMKVYAYHNLVNIFGDVPYSQALDINNISPAYDDDFAIYKDLLARIDAAVGQMDANTHSFGSADLIYGGDVAAWKTFAQSLKLKIAINLADYDEGIAKANAEDAVAAGVFTSTEDGAYLAYESSIPNTNPLHEDLVLSGRKDFVAANTIIDLMNGLNDPRMDNFFTYQVDTSDNGIDDPVWLGGAYGYSSSYSGHTHINPVIEEATFPGILMTYSEVQFYIAEAAARTWSVGQTAKEAYNEAIKASILWWGGTEAEADAYITTVDYDSYADWREAIGTQSYIAFYTRGFVAYTQIRRMDYPAMNIPPSGRTADGTLPMRFTYPIEEQTLNADNYYAAAEAIGGDDMLTKLFWDVY